jgi:two-component system, OmpR family, sensor histidine kinase MprB
MSLRLKLVVALVALSALAAGIIGFSAYASTRARLERELDDAITEIASDLFTQGKIDRDSFERERTIYGRELLIIQLVDSFGRVTTTTSESVIRPGEHDLELARATQRGLRHRHDNTVEGREFRVHTISIGDGLGAVHIGRDAGENRRVLDALRNRIALSVVLVTAAASVLALLIARQITTRLERLAVAADRVRETGDLNVSIDASGRDETARVGRSFDAMLESLARSRAEQQRLVQDAGHELRTPLTSLRTNISVLRQLDRLTDQQRSDLVDDLDAETKELTALVNEIIDVATVERATESVETIDVRALAADMCDRADRRHRRTVVVTTDGRACVARPSAVARAVSNLIDNAAKFSPEDSAIELDITGGRIEVRDRGSGLDVADPSTLFGRFVRADSARSVRGSGLGLAIVRDVAIQHGGDTWARPRPGGGAVVGFSLPVAALNEPTYPHG